MSTKRKLTKREIKKILAFIKPCQGIPHETMMSLIKKHRDQLREQLVAIYIYPELIDQLRPEIEKQYHRTLIQAAESVGVITAQSIGEKQTQSNLNTFHRAGSSENSTGTVSKFSELLNATKEPKQRSCLVYFTHGNNSIADLRHTIGNSIVQLTFGMITKSFEICVDKEREEWYDAFEILYGDEHAEYTDCISLQLNMDKLFEYKITMKQIADFVHEEFSDMVCIFSPDNIGQFDVFVDTKTIELPEEKLAFVTQDNAREIYLEEVVQPIMKNIGFCGIPGITNMYFLRDGDKWMIETDGANFSELLAHPAVDMTRLVSSNVWDIYHTLGIEAARQFMIEQFTSIMAGINVCHTMLLVDKMTHNGTISSISRYTMRREESGPFGKASFEETLDNFLKAGVFGQEEPTKGVSASIICGKRAQIGTGLCDLRMDLKMLPGMPTIEEETDDDEKCTTPFMTKFEQARLLGTRALQLSKGAPPVVELYGETDPLEIAKRELEEGKMPIIIRRPLPNGDFEDWSVKDLIVV
jgi:DNA-directed RNA polymerase beta' subunit/DNA-directed RNA polymerase subunit K/omega